MKKIIINILKFTLFFGVGVFFVWIFVRQLTPEQIQEIYSSILNANYWWLFLSFIIGLISHLARGFRSLLLLRPMGFNPSFKNSFYAVMIGYLANLALPRLGEVLRCSYLTKYENIPFQKSFGTIITERAIDLIIFIFLFVIGLIIEFQRLNIYFTTKVMNPMEDKIVGMLGNLGLYVFVGVVLLLFVFVVIYRNRLLKISIFKKISNIIRGFFEGILSVTRVKQPILFIVLTLLIWTSYFFMTYVVLFAFDELKHLPATAAFSCLNFGTIAFMLVQGGIGLYPAIIAEVLYLYNAPVTVAYAAGWVGWGVQEFMIIIFGLMAFINASLTKSKHGLSKSNSSKNT